MIIFALISLFILSAIVAAASLSDSALRGARAFMRLSRAIQLERINLEKQAFAIATPETPKTSARTISRPRALNDMCSTDWQLQPVAA